MSFKHNFVICVDMDDTIEDLLPAWVDWLDEKYNLSVKLEDVNTWVMQEAFPMLTHEEIMAPLSERSFWKTVKPKKDAIKYLWKLLIEDQQVYILTSARYNTIQPKMEEVLFTYFPMIDRHNIIIACKKQMIKCDIMIDDGAHNLINGDYYKILFDSQSNKSVDPNEFGGYRAKNWAEVYAIIKELDAIT